MKLVVKKTKNIPKPTNFGKNLKFLRRMRGISQSELAKQVDLSRNNVASYESGVVEPNVKKFIKVCTYFNIDPKDMLQVILEEHPINNNNNNNISAQDTDTVVDIYLKDHLEAFIIQTNEMTKVLEGYKLFFEMKQENQSFQKNKELYSTLQDLLDLLQSLISSNWNLIQSVYPNHGEEE